jgi:hypothetical protein
LLPTLLTSASWQIKALAFYSVEFFLLLTSLLLLLLTRYLNDALRILN